MLENTEGAIKYEKSRETGNIPWRYTRYIDYIAVNQNKNTTQYVFDTTIDVFRNRWLPSYRSWTLGGVTIVCHYESVTIGCLH